MIQSPLDSPKGSPVAYFPKLKPYVAPASERLIPDTLTVHAKGTLTVEQFDSLAAAVDAATVPTHVAKDGRLVAADVSPWDTEPCAVTSCLNQGRAIDRGGLGSICEQCAGEWRKTKKSFKAWLVVKNAKPEKKCEIAWCQESEQKRCYHVCPDHLAEYMRAAKATRLGYDAWFAAKNAERIEVVRINGPTFDETDVEYRRRLTGKPKCARCQDRGYVSTGATAAQGIVHPCPMGCHCDEQNIPITLVLQPHPETDATLRARAKVAHASTRGGKSNLNLEMRLTCDTGKDLDAAALELGLVRGQPSEPITPAIVRGWIEKVTSDDELTTPCGWCRGPVPLKGPDPLPRGVTFFCGGACFESVTRYGAMGLAFQAMAMAMAEPEGKRVLSIFMIDDAVKRCATSLNPDAFRVALACYLERHYTSAGAIRYVENRLLDMVVRGEAPTMPEQVAYRRAVVAMQAKPKGRPSVAWWRR